MNCGFPVAVKCPVDTNYEWLSTKQDGELFAIARSRKESDQKLWARLSIPNPIQYINMSLYFNGHLDSNMICKCEVQIKALEQSVTDSDDLAAKFENLVSNPLKPFMTTTMGTLSALLTKERTPMEVGDLPQKVPEGATAPKPLIVMTQAHRLTITQTWK